MTTRTYQLAFAGPGTIPLPGGVFFFVKSATSALNIRTRGTPSSPTDFTNVGAGLRFGPVPDSKKWTYLDVESLGAQNVEVIVSDDAEVDVANTVSIAGGVVVTELPSTTFTTPVQTALTTATSIDIAATPRRRISIGVDSASSGSVWVRDQSATANAGSEIQPGTEKEFRTTAALRIRNNSGVTVTVSTTEET